MNGDFKSYFVLICTLIASIVIPVLLIMVIGSNITTVFPQSRWAYAMQYDTESGNVVIDPKPHGCEFFKAPIGSKYCHFDKVVTTRKGDESVNQKTLVFVRWDKVSE